MPVLTGVNPGVVSPSSGEHPITPTHAKKTGNPTGNWDKKKKEKILKKMGKGNYLSESSIGGIRLLTNLHENMARCALH